MKDENPETRTRPAQPGHGIRLWFRTSYTLRLHFVGVFISLQWFFRAELTPLVAPKKGVEPLLPILYNSRRCRPTLTNRSNLRSRTFSLSTLSVIRNSRLTSSTPELVNSIRLFVHPNNS